MTAQSVSVEPDAPFTDRIESGASARHPPAAGRYHLYASPGCPFAHRARVVHSVLGLNDAISLSYVVPGTDDEGRWHFEETGRYADPNEGAAQLDELYKATRASFHGPGTVPVLWDKQEKRVVNGESRDVARILGTSFHEFQGNKVTLIPPGREAELDATIDKIQPGVNWGIYRIPSAETQAGYDLAIKDFFGALDHWEQVLDSQRFLMGDVVTEADVFLWTTLARHDAVYYTLFWSNKAHVDDYPNLAGWLRDVAAQPGIGETLDLETTRTEYFGSFKARNPHGLLPATPLPDFSAEHPRAVARAERFGWGPALTPLPAVTHVTS